MSFVANPFVVVLDANVLFPVRVRDILLSFAEEGLFRARLTDEIVDEWTRNLIKLKPHLEGSVRRQVELLHTHFPEYFVQGYRPLVEGLALPDPDDRHVLAAAIRCSAQVIVTENRRDFPADVLDEYGIEVLGADDVLVNTYDLYSAQARQALKTVRSRYRNPPMTATEFLIDLVRYGLPKLAAMARQDIEFL